MLFWSMTLVLSLQRGWKGFGNNPLGCNQQGNCLREHWVLRQFRSERRGREGTAGRGMDDLKIGNIILLEKGLHLCYRVLVKSLIAEIVANCTFIVLCSAWEAGIWFVKCWVLNSFSCRRCDLRFDPLKHYKTGNNLKSEAMGIPPARLRLARWWSVWSQPHCAGVLSG